MYIIRMYYLDQTYEDQYDEVYETVEEAEEEAERDYMFPWDVVEIDENRNVIRVIE